MPDTPSDKWIKRAVNMIGANTVSPDLIRSRAASEIWSAEVLFARAIIELAASMEREAKLREDAFQQRVTDWMLDCFTPEIAADTLERTDRFIEEALELAQTEPQFSAERAHALVDYVFSRPVGEPHQEVGGVMVTLAALCGPNRLDMMGCAEDEYERISQPEVIQKIRAKQAGKPVGSALPVALTTGGQNGEG